MKYANAKTTKICAYCRNWYDPGNSHIKPKNVVSGMYQYDDKAKEPCAVLGLRRPSSASCAKFTNKLYNNLQ